MTRTVQTRQHLARFRPSLVIAALSLFFGSAWPSQSGASLAIRDASFTFGPRAQVSVDPLTGTFSAVRFAVPERLPDDGTALDESVREFVMARAAALRLRPGTDVYTAAEEREQFGLRRVRLQQKFHEIPVLGSDLMVVVGQNRRIRMINGRVSPGIMVSTRFHIPAEDAIRQALIACGLGEGARYRDAELVIVPRKSGYSLGYNVHVADSPSHPVWQVIVDAVSGKILSAIDATPYMDGDANVFPADDSSATSLTGVTLHRLNGSGTALAGASVVVHNGAAAPFGDAVSSGGHFSYTPNDPDTTHFDEANAYYHVDHFLNDFLGGLGFSGLDSAVVVHVHGGFNHTSPTGCQCDIYLNAPDSIFFRDAAKCADQLYHETMHAVTFSFGIQYEQGQVATRNEAAPMHEGFSDYFAAVATSDPRIGERNYRAYPSGRTRVDRDTSTYNYSHFATVGDQPYGAAQIWSGALWDLRAAIGTVADQIVLQSLAYLPHNPTFSNGLDAIMEADADFHSGTHATAIAAVFSGRHIVSLGVQGVISGPIVLPVYGSGTYHSIVQGGRPPYAYAWSKLRHGLDPDTDPEWLYPWVSLGTDSTATTSDEVEFKVRLVVTDSLGSTLTDSLDVAVVPLVDYFDPPTIEILGPGSLGVNEEGAYTADISGGGGALSEWSAFHFSCEGSREGAPFQTGVGDTFRVGSEASFEVDVSGSDGYGRGCSDSKQISVVLNGSPVKPIPCFGVRVAPQGDGIVRGSATFIVDSEARQRVSIKLYDISGRSVRELMSGSVEPGPHSYSWDSRGLRSGVYFMKATNDRSSRGARVLVLH
jgi:Fungalysin metallopeptidase (M36)/Fungalysin/Thermolysin Propeptide Motif